MTFLPDAFVEELRMKSCQVLLKIREEEIIRKEDEARKFRLAMEKLLADNREKMLEAAEKGLFSIKIDFDFEKPECFSKDGRTRFLLNGFKFVYDTSYFYVSWDV